MKAGTQQGVTLIELVTVMIVIAVIGFVSLRVSDPTTFTVSAQADRFARDIRHIQMLAMSSGQQLQLTTAGTTSYTVVCRNGGTNWPCDNANPVTDPAIGTGYAVTTQNGVTVSAATLDFDRLGRPVDGAGGVLAADTLFTLANPGGAETSTVTVSALTGFPGVSY